METKLNIAEILKDKPKGTKLYSPLFGKCTFLNIYDSQIYISHHTDTVSSFYSNGTYFEFSEAEPLLFPSKEMHDWSKFTWKKGDVLVSKGRRTLHVIFEGFNDDTYTTFKGKHYLCDYSNNENCDDEEYYNDYHKEVEEQTIEFEKDNINNAQTYINIIEKKLDGKLNLETLEIEKQLEFKDGDIVVYGKSVAICRKIYKHTLSFYVSLNEMVGLLFADEVESSEEYRFATEAEKQQLFSALENEGKAWDAVKKQIVDLKPKWTPKPFDRVITRTPETPWTANFFSHIDSDGIKNCIDDRYIMCLPYNDETAKLIGTTNNWRG